VRQVLTRQLELPGGYYFDLGGRVESQARAGRALTLAIGAAPFGVFVLLLVALGSAAEAAMILGTVPIAFVGGILELLLAGETGTCRRWSDGLACSASPFRTVWCACNRVTRQTAATVDSIRALGRRGAGPAGLGDIHQEACRRIAGLCRRPEHRQRSGTAARLVCERSKRSARGDATDFGTTARSACRRVIDGRELRVR
jgi:hypothetical protein